MNVDEVLLRGVLGVTGGERERPLTSDVARRIVAADDEDASVRGADDTRAADARRPAPHHLCVVPDHRAGVAGVAVPVVVPLLVHPRVHRVRRAPRPPGRAPEDVLAERPTGVHQRAVAGALRGVVPSVLGHCGVPDHRADAIGCTRRVVKVHEVLRGVLG